MSKFLLQKYQSLPAYIPGEHAEGGGFIRLNTNESPFPPSSGVKEAVAREVDLLGYYNDPDCMGIRTALADLYGVTPQNVVCANGSDEVLYFAFKAFAQEIALPDITYGYYDLFCGALGIPMTKIPLKDDFTVDYREFCGVGKTVVLANPNAPTGYALPIEQIEEIVKTNPYHVVIIDEAYVDFGWETSLPLIDKYDNLLVVRTFSKSRSLAGARLGYAFGCKELIAQLEIIRNAVNLYSVNLMTQAAGVAACRENGYYMENCQKIIQNRQMTIDGLRALGFTVLDSQGNFVFARCGRMPGRELAQKLRERGILVRRWDAPRIADYLRISIGTKEEMQALLAAVNDILGV